MNTTKLYLIILLCAFVSPFNANGKPWDDEFSHNRFAMSGTLTSSDSYSLDLSYHYMPWPCLGLGGGIGYWKNIYVEGWASGPTWNIDEDDEKPSNLYLRPSIVLKTPGLRIRAVRWSLYAEPGLIVNVPYQRVCINRCVHWPMTWHSEYVSTTRGQWLATDIRLGLCLEIGRGAISAGYMMSNLDIYSQYRHLSYNGIPFSKFYPTKSFMQGAYMTISVNF